jgi:hypothetical protein
MAKLFSFSYQFSVKFPDSEPLAVALGRTVTEQVAFGARTPVQVEETCSKLVVFDKLTLTEAVFTFPTF